MAQFSVYKNEDRSSFKTYPYFLDVQSDLLDDLNSRMVIPLSPFSSVKGNNAKQLCPIVSIISEEYILLTHQLTSVPVSLLKQEITSLDSFRHEIISAIDFLITGI